MVLMLSFCLLEIDLSVKCYCRLLTTLYYDCVRLSVNVWVSLCVTSWINICMYLHSKPKISGIWKVFHINEFKCISWLVAACQSSWSMQIVIQTHTSPYMFIKYYIFDAIFVILHVKKKVVNFSMRKCFLELHCCELRFILNLLWMVVVVVSYLPFETRDLRFKWFEWQHCLCAQVSSLL